MEKIRHRNDCRLCHQENISLIHSFSNSTLANELVSNPNQQQDEFPLDLYQCDDCGLFQLLDVVNPELMFKDYIYVSGTSQVMRDHFKSYAEQILELIKYKITSPNSLVVDIGANDSTLLKYLKNKARVVGVEPASNLATKSNAEGILTINDFFNVEVAKSIIKDHGKAEIVTCNNCLAHLDNVDEIILGVKELLTDDGTFVFENAYFIDTIKTRDYSQIYHEHVSMFSINPLDIYFKKHGMTIVKIEHQDIHGGSIRVFVKNKIVEQPQEVLDFIYEEEMWLTDYVIDASIINYTYIANKLKNRLIELKQQGKTIAGVTASAKSTSFLHYANIGNDLLDFICEDSAKIGKYSSGKHIPIVSFDDIYIKKPDYLVMLSYNFVDSIMKKHINFEGTWVIPLPELKEIKS